LGGRRTPSNWRYRVIKHYLRRVVKFKERAKTYEEYLAWKKVEEWFMTILSKKRFNEKNQSIGLPLINVSTL